MKKCLGFIIHNHASKILLCLFFIAFTFKTYSQSTSPILNLDKLISISVENKTLKEVLDELSIKENISFSYHHSDKDKFCEVSPISDIFKLDNTFTKSIINDNKYESKFYKINHHI